jgi:hypothetical protein
VFKRAKAVHALDHWQCDVQNWSNHNLFTDFMPVC